LADRAEALVTRQTADGTSAWETGTQTVAPGVHRVPLPLPLDHLKAVNVYVLEGAGGPVVIDSGWALPRSEELLAGALRGLGFHLGDVAEFLVTHIHGDHYAQAVALRKRFGTRVALGAGEQASMLLMRADPGGQGARDEVALLRAGAEPLAARLRARPVHERLDPTDWPDPDRWIADYERREVGRRELVAVPTPGHTRGHVSFHDEAAGLLFAGDHVLPRITPSIGFEPARVELPLRSYLASLSLLLTRPDAVLLPAHGPVAPSVHARVHELLDHHRNRLDEMAAAVEAGADTAWATAHAVTWTRRGRAFDELDAFNAMLAVLETDTHLRLLAAEGRLVAGDRAGVTTYRTPDTVDRRTA
jgi:glyoxylase-like metal-dependent hydrolase (beta-lactamase superfamily II)